MSVNILRFQVIVIPKKVIQQFLEDVSPSTDWLEF